MLVTGGAGFMGSALCAALLARGARVRVLDDLSRGSFSRLGGYRDAIELVHGDIRDRDTVRRAVEGMDVVCHLAYINGTEHFYAMPDVVLDVAVGGMLNVIHACVASGVRELVVASSSEVYQSASSVPTDERVPLSVPDPLNPRFSYGGGKLVSELLAINFGRRHFDRVVIFRPHNVYGPDMGREHVIPQLIERMLELPRSSGGPVSFVIQGTGEETRAFVYIDDLVNAVLGLIEHGEHLGIYNVGTEDEITIKHLAQEIARCLGTEIEIVPSPLLPGSTPRRCPNITKIRALGFEPRVPLADGLAWTVHWYREHRPLKPRDHRHAIA